jgi:Tol biopolymer transport system component
MEEIAFAAHCCNPQNADLWVIDRNGSGLHRLTGSSSSDFEIPVAYRDQAPSWSPHARAIAFSQYVPSTNTQAIFVMNADGSGMRQVMKLPAARPRVNAQASIQEWHRKRRYHHSPREIESGGNWARWSPELQ